MASGDIENYVPVVKYKGLNSSKDGTLSGSLTLSGANTVSGVQTYTGANTHSGVEVHTGAETHSGDEVFSGSPTGIVVAKSVSFVENGSGTSYVGTVPIPAGSQLLDIIFVTTVLWDGTSASLIIGDDDDDNGFLAATSIKATDLLVGEQFRLSAHGAIDTASGQHLGKIGAYVVNTTGRVGQATADSSGGWYTTANNIIATITPGAADGSAGRSFMTVTYATPTAIDQVAT